MATTRTIGPGFLTAFPWAAEIKAAGGFAQFEDRGVQYVVMLDSVRMRVLHRTALELFETTIENDMKKQPGLSLTGCFMDNLTPGGFALKGFGALTIGDPLPAAAGLQKFAGVVIEGGVKNPGSTSEPGKVMLAFKDTPTPQLLIEKGDPDPSTGITEAFGGLGAVVLRSVKLPSGRPEHADLDHWYRVRDGAGTNAGTPFVAISRRAKIIVAAVKPHGPRLSIDVVRDRFVDAGFEDVAFLDGGDSAYLNVLGTWVVRMGPYKKQITVFGTKFFYSSPP